MSTMRYIFSISYLLSVCVILCGCPNVPQYGSLTVKIAPAGAISVGAQWRVDNGLWQDSGNTVNALSLGEHAIHFKAVNGWTIPQDQLVTIMPKKTTSVTGNYLSQTANPGSVQVVITPVEAVNAGAQWQIDNSSWQDSGATVAGITEGKHIITFSAIYQWVKADDQVITVSASAPDTSIGTYTPLSTSFVVLGYNDLGMHCMGNDFSEFMILPPYNNLYAQIIERGGEEPRIVSGGVSVNYEIPANTTSANKTNFWNFTGQLFNVSLTADVGLTGNSLSGSMIASGRNDWVATGIPITPINDAGQIDPYSMATITVMQNGQEVGRTHTVVPVSWEMRCDLCHVPSGGDTVASNILTAHDTLHGTTLMQERPVVCGRCHGQPELSLTGNASLPSLSSAMHTAHAPRMQMINIDVPCYACHPGIQTQCLRDVHFGKGYTCTFCHGDMNAVGNPSRRPWVDEPRCADCHSRTGFEFEQPDTLFRNSKGHMGIHCEACHGSPHAITPTITRRDNEQAITVQGVAGIIHDCTVCHVQTPDDPFPHRFQGSD
jgi:hypothetical protein